MLEIQAVLRGEELEIIDGWHKHIYCEGSREHVLSWNTNGVICSHKNCVINRDSALPRPDEAIFL